MQIQIFKRFTDSNTNKLFGTGVYDLDRNTAMRLHKQGRGRILDQSEANAMDAAVVAAGGVLAPEPEAPAKTSKASAKEPTTTGNDTEIVETSTNQGKLLPEDFPEREALAKLGYTTVESLNQKGVDTALTKALSKGAANKIGLALNKLQG